MPQAHPWSGSAGLGGDLPILYLLSSGSFVFVPITDWLPCSLAGHAGSDPFELWGKSVVCQVHRPAQFAQGATKIGVHEQRGKVIWQEVLPFLQQMQGMAAGLDSVGFSHII